MGTSTVVDRTRAALGSVGAFLPISVSEIASADAQRAAVGRLERAGFRVTWTNEGIGKDAFVQASVLLAATERMVLGTGISNIWTRAPQTMHGAAALLAQSYPDRFVLGVGVGYAEQAALVGREYGSPLATLRDYLTAMDEPGQMPAPDVTYPRIVAANGPKMVALAAELADGAMPAMLPPEFTVQARQGLGPDKLLIVGMTVVPDRERARQAVAGRLARPNSPYGAGLARLGYSERELTDVSDRLVDALVGYGDAESIAAKVRAHLDAGADHVMIVPAAGEFETGIARLEELASIV